MVGAAQWIKDRLSSGSLTHDDVVALIKLAQVTLGVDADGKPGSGTLEALKRELEAGIAYAAMDDATLKERAEMMIWLQENWQHIAGIALGLHALASAITAATPTPKDDALVGKVYRVIETIALVVGKAKHSAPKAEEEKSEADAE